MSDDAERPLMIGLQSIVVTNSLNGTLSLLHEAILTPIDSSVPELWLPATVCDLFATVFGLQYQEASGRYAITESTRTKLRASNPMLTLTVADGLVEGKTINLNFPYAAFDLEATYPIFPEATRYFPIRKALNESQYVVGRVFLQEAYLAVDYERKSFNISQAVFDSPMPESDIVTIVPLNSTSLNSPSAPGARSHHLSPGAIAGIVIGAVAGIALLAYLVWFFCSRRSNDEADHLATVETQEMSRHPDEPEIMGTVVGELPASHGLSEVDLDKSSDEPKTRSNLGLYELEGNAGVHLKP
jgi:hypothetical protein